MLFLKNLRKSNKKKPILQPDHNYGHTTIFKKHKHKFKHIGHIITLKLLIEHCQNDLYQIAKFIYHFDRDI